MAVTSLKTTTLLGPSHPALDTKHASVTDVQSISSSSSTDSYSETSTIPIPPELPQVPEPTHITLPVCMDGFSPEMQANITSYIEKHHPDATTEVEIETILDILLHVVGETFTGNERVGAALSKIIHSSNSARQISSLAWRYLPAAKKHQVYGAVAGRYGEAAQLANRTSQQNILDEYAVLFTGPQVEAVRRDIQSWAKVEEACELFERAADRACGA